MSDKGAAAQTDTTQATSTIPQGADTKATGTDAAATASTKAADTTVKTGASILEGGIKADAKATEDGTDAGKRAAAATTWPDDWRQQLTGGDEKKMALAKRYASPNAMADALYNLRSRLDSGEFKKPLPADATDDEKAAWRKDNGVPDKAEGYELPKGLQVPDYDKPILDGFLKFAHERNYQPAQVQDTLNWFYAAREQENTQQYESDQLYRTEQEEALRAEWGQEFRGNVNGLKSFMTNTFGPEMTQAIMGARLGDQTLAGDNPAFLKGLVSLMKEINPAATLTLPAGQYGGKGVDARIAELEGIMAKDITAWQRESNAPAQKEYQELLGTRAKMAERNKAA